MPPPSSARRFPRHRKSCGPEAIHGVPHFDRVQARCRPHRTATELLATLAERTEATPQSSTLEATTVSSHTFPDTDSPTSEAHTACRARTVSQSRRRPRPTARMLPANAGPKGPSYAAVPPPEATTVSPTPSPTPTDRNPIPIPRAALRPCPGLAPSTSNRQAPFGKRWAERRRATPQSRHPSGDHHQPDTFPDTKKRKSETQHRVTRSDRVQSRRRPRRTARLLSANAGPKGHELHRSPATPQATTVSPTPTPTEPRPRASCALGRKAGRKGQELRHRPAKA
jgi:hypothetical protein